MIRFLKKIYIPEFFKTKKFLVFSSLFFLFFLFTPISFVQINKKIETFINTKAKIGVKNFQKQTGLQIEWEKLDFNIFTMTVHLEEVKIKYLATAYSKQIEELKFLDGLQNVKKISARPSIFSLLFDKKIFLSKLKIQTGQISLKTLKQFQKNRMDQSKSIRLPIKKIVIKDTNIKIRHKNYEFNLLDIKTSVFQNKNRVFNFNLFVKSFYIDENLEITNLSHHFLSKFNKDKIYELSLKGIVKPNQFTFSYIHIKNDFFTSTTKFLDINFDSQKLLNVSVASAGSLPVGLIQTAGAVLGKKIEVSNSYLNYDLTFNYRKNKTYNGQFKLSAKDLLVRSAHFKSVDVQGKFKNQFLVIQQGTVEIKDQGRFSIKKAEWSVLKEHSQFNFSVESERLSLDFIQNNLLKDSHLPIQADLTGLISCQGEIGFANGTCEFKGSSERVQVDSNQTELFSVYDFDHDLQLQLENKNLKFVLKSQKEESNLDIEGEYSFLLNELSATYSLKAEQDKDIRFNLPFELKGKTLVRNGTILIQKDKVDISGFLITSVLTINSYQLENVASSYRFSDNELVFYDMTGLPGLSKYSATIDIDFNNSVLNVKVDSSLFYLKDFIKSLKNYIHLPFNFNASGTFQFFISYPWNNPEKKQFELTGDFFNVLIDKDFFKQSNFKLSFKDNQGLVESFSLIKTKGEIKGVGSFDKDYNMNVDILLQKLSLENIDFLNRLFTFNQLGDINGSMKMTGSFKNPQVVGDITLSNTFFYSYPVKDSQLKVSVDKESFSLSGNIIDEIKMDQFSYLFSKEPKIKMRGRFSNLDLVTILFSKDRKNKDQDYSSKLTGLFELEKQKYWQGFVRIKDVAIYKDSKQLTSKAPFSVLFKKQKWFLEPSWFVDNKNQFLTIEEKNESQLSIKGMVDLSFFSVLFPFLEDLQGHVVSQVTINKNLKNLKPIGSLQIQNALFQLSYLPNFTNVNASLIFSKNNLYINDFNSSAGGGFVTGLGTIFYDFVKPPKLSLNLNFEKIYFQIPEGFNTRGSGKIKITGDQTPYLISGEYNIDSGNIVKDFSTSVDQVEYDFDLFQKENQKNSSGFNLNLKLNTLQPIAVNSSLIQTSIEGTAQVYGPFNSLLMKGKFDFSKELQENLIFFRGQEFKVSSGSILFSNSKPKNPYIDISANTVLKERVIDPLESQEEIEKEYSIFLFLKGLADNLDFSLRSTPVLNEKEIISLLTLGISSRRFDSNVKQDVTDYSYQILTSLLIEKPLNREIKEFLGLDFRLTPYINILNKPVTKVTLSKNWLEKWRASFSRTIEESAHSDIRLKYKLNQKISLTAFWENSDQLKLEEFQQDWLGFDFEFNFDF